ncbi:zeta toxin family protein [Mycobacterium sp. M23085]|uniref:zeta toxin family protein n=1 Tax=Mycobacterium sp. M23085 TaxID=3378087 RepID=UPI0038781221
MTLSEEQWQHHIEFVERALAGQEPTTTRFADELGLWEEERANAQQGLIDELWDGARDVPRGRNAVIAGGMAGAGKTTVLDGPAGLTRSEYLIVNPDDIKLAMAARGMIPEIDGLSPMEASPIVHDEASELAYTLAAMAYEEQINLLWDITMGDTKKVRLRIEWLRDAEYAAIDAVFVDVPIQTGAERAMKRYREDQEAYAKGEATDLHQLYGGRYVPASVFADSQPLLARYSSRNHEVFCQVRDDFHSTVEYDNSGTEAILRRVTGTRWAQSA